jgi:foldase protein PrsA
MPMSRRRWCLLVILLLGVTLAGCGGGVPGNAVVQVGNSPITKATFKHWMVIAAAASNPGSTATPVLPQPPAYSACVEHLKADPPKLPAGQPEPTAASLQTHCKQEYEQLKKEVLSVLIQDDWVIGEAHSMGIQLSDAEVKQELAKLVKEEFPKPGSFEKYLATSHQTVSDLLLRVKAHTLLPRKIEAKVTGKTTPVTAAQVEKYYNANKSRFVIPGKHGKPGAQQTLAQVAPKIKQQLVAAQQQAPLAAFVKSFKNKWTAETDCEPSYIVENCKQYKAPKSSVVPTAP